MNLFIEKNENSSTPLPEACCYMPGSKEVLVGRCLMSLREGETMICKEFKKLWYDKDEEELSPEEWRSIEEHLSLCRECKRKIEIDDEILSHTFKVLRWLDGDLSLPGWPDVKECDPEFRRAIKEEALREIEEVFKGK